MGTTPKVGVPLLGFLPSAICHPMGLAPVGFFDPTFVLITHDPILTKVS